MCITEEGLLSQRHRTFYSKQPTRNGDMLFGRPGQWAIEGCPASLGLDSFPGIRKFMYSFSIVLILLTRV